MTIEQRMDKLERQNRHLKWGLGGLVVLGVAGLLMGAGAAADKEDVPNIIRTHRIEVVGADGKPGVIIGLTSNNTGTFSTLNEAGTKVVTLGVTKGGEGTVTTHNKKGNDLVKVGATTSGEGVITTHDAGGQRLLELGMTVKNQPKIFSYKPDGTPRASWP